MKWNELCKFFTILFLALALIPCSLFAKFANRYEYPSSSGLVIDEYTGKPVEGATVQVSWNALRRTGNEHNPDSMLFHGVTVLTDKNGIYTIPAWTNEIDREWEYEFYPSPSISKPRNKPIETAPEISNPIIAHGPVIQTFNIGQEPIGRDELFEQETNIISISEETPSNSLAFYTAHNARVEGGRFIDAQGLSKARGLSKGAYIRPKPELVITHIKSFSTSSLNLDYWEPGFKIIAVKLFPTDARKLEILRQTRVGARPLINNFVLMLGGKPTSSLWPPNSGSISVGYLYFPKGQDTHEVEQFLKSIVQDK